jgi:hypothetical protein
LECDVTFVKHLQVIKLVFCLGKPNKVDDQDMMAGELFSASDLNCQEGMSKLTMKSNVAMHMAPPFDFNPLTKMWCLVTIFRIFFSNFLGYVKLIELAMV